MTTLLREPLARLAERLRLSVRALAALAALVMTTIVVLVGFGGVTEDVAARNGQQHYDFGRLDWFVQHRSHAEVRIADALAKLGSVGAMAVLAVVASAVLWQRRHSIAVALAPLAAFVGAAGATTVVKTLVGRGRPPVPLRLVADTEPSFPSGHTTATTAVVLTIVVIVAVVVVRRFVMRAVVIVGGVGLSAAVGISRLVLGAHWPTDVVAGWLLGTAIAAVALAVSMVLAPRLPTGPAVYRAAMTRVDARRRPRNDGPALIAPAPASAGTP